MQYEKVKRGINKKYQRIFEKITKKFGVNEEEKKEKISF